MGVKKVRPKQVFKPPTAADHNAIAASADMYRKGPDLSPDRQWPVSQTIIAVKNNSGSALRRGDVVALDMTKLLTTVHREHVWLGGKKLTAANVLRNAIIAVLIDPLADGSIGPAQIAGAGVAYVNVIATWHRRAYPVASADVLASGIFGPLEILSTPAGTGERLCYVSIGHASNRGMWASAQTGGISAGTWPGSGTLTLGSGTVLILDPTSTTGDYEEEAGHEVTAYNASTAIAEGEVCFVEPGDDWLPTVTVVPCA